MTLTQTIHTEEGLKRIKDVLRPLAEFVVSLTGYGTVLHVNDVMPEFKKAYALGVESARLEAMRDVCMYCGGRAPQWHTEVSGKPNSAGNYVHISREGDSIVLCEATSIQSRINYEKYNASTEGAQTTLIEAIKV